MPAKKEYNDKTAQSIEAMAACCCGQKMITTVLPDVIKDDLEPEGLYRQAWEQGKEKGKYKVLNTYFKMATSGKSWPAVKHFLATQCNIIERTENIIADKHPDVSGLTDAQLKALIDIAEGKSCNP